MERKGYRTVVVKLVQKNTNSILVSFEELEISLQMNKDFLHKKDIDFRDIVPGVLMCIKGREGNADSDLLRVDPLEDIILYSE